MHVWFYSKTNAKHFFLLIHFPWLKRYTSKHSKSFKNFTLHNNEPTWWKCAHTDKNARHLTIKPLHINYINIPERRISMRRYAKVCPLIIALCGFTTSWLRLFKLRRQVVRSPKLFKPLILGWSLHFPQL